MNSDKVRIGILSLFALLLASCSGCSKKSEPQQQVYEDTSAPYTYDEPTSTDAPTEPNDGKAHVPLPPNDYMSEREAAFQDGEALGEEDRMNGTRSHVGMNYDNEAEEDEYDDGYDE